MATPDGAITAGMRNVTGILGFRGAITNLAGAATFLVAFANGTYANDRRTGLGLVVWWALVVVAAVGARGLTWSLEALAVSSTLTLFAAWTLASVAWAADAEAAFNEFTRVALYLGVLVLVVALARAETVGFWADGVAVGILAVAATAVASRLYPDIVGSTAGTATLPVLRSRLSYPVGYWNGLGVLAGLGVPLLLSSALRARVHVVRGLFLAGVPLLAATIYLTSSRGAVAALVVGVVVFMAMTVDRWSAFGALLIAGFGAALAVQIVAERVRLANGVRDSVSSGEARAATLWLAVIMVSTCVAYVLVLALRVPRGRPARSFGWILAGVLVLGVVVLASAAHPVRRFGQFRQPPSTSSAEHRDFVKAHLLSASGNGRWQFWEAAVDEYRTRPINGRGAGSYAEWWAQHGSLPLTIQDAHSLFLETLGELGIVGLVLLLLVVACALFGVTRAVKGRAGAPRLPAAGAAGAFCAFLVAAGVDWMWELTAVAVVAFVCLGLVLAVGGEAPEPRNAKRRLVVGTRLLAGVVALAFVGAQVVPFLAQIEIGRSQAAARRGDLHSALDHARTAVRVQPWAATPLVQLALVSEQAGSIGSARAAIKRAITRDRDGWKLHLIAARLATEAGDVAEARRSFDRARALNPRSPLFG